MGQSPLPFSGGSLSLQLPGESVSTYVARGCSGKALYIGWISTAGSVYKVTAHVTGVDVATGKSFRAGIG